MDTYIGIDTSCYTTSLAVVDSEGNLLSEARRLLAVPAGGRGLAQSEALFQHVNNLPELFEQVSQASDLAKIRGVAGSTRPRPVEGSYMPVFRVAESYGHSLASVLGVPFAATSHQEGHLAAGLFSAGGPAADRFLAVHLSGGTTELLCVTRQRSGPDTGFAVEVLGGTSDLHAGQFIDRIGVALGLPFPAGPHLEKLAKDSAGENITVPSAVRGYEISFSGPEAAALRLMASQAPPADIARAVEKCIVKTLVKLLQRAFADSGLRDVLIVGGVAANTFIRDGVQTKLESAEAGGRLFYASPGLSGDNAVGVALLGKEKISQRD